MDGSNYYYIVVAWIYRETLLSLDVCVFEVITI
jgi:hypothetical protein